VLGSDDGMEAEDRQTSLDEMIVIALEATLRIE
jgi:purine-nucleoside phosphorylase